MNLSVKKVICIMLSGIMCLIGSGCGTAGKTTNTTKNIVESVSDSTTDSGVSYGSESETDISETTYVVDSADDEPNTADSVMAPYEKVINEAAKEDENAKYFIYDSNKDGNPELIIDDAYGMSYYIYQDGEVYLTASYSCGDFAIYTYPEKNGFVLMTEAENQTENMRKYEVYQISENGEPIEINLLFEHNYPLTSDEYYCTDAERLFGSLLIFNPKTKIPSSQKINSFSVKDLSGVRYYNIDFGGDINKLKTDILTLGHFKEYVFFDMDADGNDELIMSEENAWSKYCFALKDGKLLNLGCVEGKYGIGENENKRLVATTGGTGMSYHAEYYVEDNTVYLNPNWNLGYYSDQNGIMYFYKNEKITEEEYKNAALLKSGLINLITE